MPRSWAPASLFRLLLGLLALACSESTELATDTDTSPGDATSVPDAPGDTASLPEKCETPDGASAPDYLSRLGCRADFEQLASQPIVSSLPGARTVKTVIDRADGNALYFQNSTLYTVHHAFAEAHLSGAGRPLVQSLGEFNQSEYYSPERRFLLGAVTHYEGPDVWAFEIAPYDTASPAMVTLAFEAVREHAWFGPALRFHPTSQAVEAMATSLPSTIPLVTTDELFGAIDYQPLNLAESIGRLRFVRAEELEGGTAYSDFRDILVLDRVPNELSAVLGTITAEFQTPLSHVNVLAQNRGTPNMGLRGAMENPDLRALEGKWVRLRVGALEYTATESDKAAADAWWEAHRPAVVQVPKLDTTVTDLVDLDGYVDVTGDLRQHVKDVVPAIGGKAGHYSALLQVPDLPVRPAFAIPVYYFDVFMTEFGFYTRLEGLIADAAFEAEPSVRDQRLGELRKDIERTLPNADFLSLVSARINTAFAGNTRMRFRSSTNAEDLDGFTGAGLYTSKTGDPNDPERPIARAITEVWASVYSFRAFEERRYRGIDHRAVGMALLCHNSFPDEVANGVALTANPFDAAGIEPGYYINVQAGETSVVLPDPSVRADAFLFQYETPGQPIIFYEHSNQIPAGTNVLTREETFALGGALSKLHAFFRPAYGADPKVFYGMDVEFKFVAGDGHNEVVIKQARPHPGRGTDPLEDLP